MLLNKETKSNNLQTKLKDIGKKISEFWLLAKTKENNIFLNLLVN